MVKAVMLWVLFLCTASASFGITEFSAQAGEPLNPRIRQALQASDDQDYERASDLLALAKIEGVAEDSIQTARLVIEARKDAAMRGLQAQLEQALSESKVDAAKQILINLIAMGLDQRGVQTLRSEIQAAEAYGQYRPWQRFSDPLHGSSGLAPEMIVVPSGRFVMGSSPTEKGHEGHEAPRHRVTIHLGFAMSRHEVTVEAFKGFINATDYQTTAEVRGFSQVYEPITGRMIQKKGVDWRHDYLGNRATSQLPVIHVSWKDAQAYVTWLSAVTHEYYRLPSESEFEYVLRAGTQDIYPWGNSEPPSLIENLAGEGDQSSRGLSWSAGFEGYTDGHWGPAPVGTFNVNAWGFNDLNGNVSEWVEDCWHDSYVQAPSSALAWVNRGCMTRVVRGGSWVSTPSSSRSAFRMKLTEETTGAQVGFRVVRELSHD